MNIHINNTKFVNIFEHKTRPEVLHMQACRRHFGQSFRFLILFLTLTSYCLAGPQAADALHFYDLVGLRVEIESDDCTSESAARQTSQMALEGGTPGVGYYLKIWLKAKVETTDPGWDRVGLNTDHWSHQNGAGYDNWILESTKDEADCSYETVYGHGYLTYNPGENIILIYDPKDINNNQNLYAEITRVALIAGGKGGNNNNNPGGGGWLGGSDVPQTPKPPDAPNVPSDDDKSVPADKPGCGNCGDGSCSLKGNGGVSLGSLNVNINLGQQSENDFGGAIRLYTANASNSTLYSPSKLFLAIPPGSDRVPDTGTLQQLMTSQVFVDVVVTNSTVYELKFYQPAQVSGPNGTVYTPTGDPFSVWKFEPLTSDDGTNLKVTKTIGAESTIYEFTWSDDGLPGFKGWSLTTKSGGQTQQIESYLTEYNSSGARIGDERIIRNGGNITISETYRQFTKIDQAELVTQVTIGSNASARTTYYDYWNDSGDQDTYLQLKKITHPNGFWEYFADYNSDGDVTKRIEQFKSNAFTGNLTADEDDNRVFDYEYTTGTASGEPYALETFTESLDGTVVSRKWRRLDVTSWQKNTGDSNNFRRIAEGVATNLSATFTGNGSDEGILTTVTYLYKDTDNGAKRKKNLPYLIVHPDGTASHFKYSTASNNTIIISETAVGVPSTTTPSDFSANITSGTYETLHEDPYGNLMSRNIRDISSNLTIEDVVVSSMDAFGRPLTLTYFDGTAGEYTETRSYNCCGLDVVTDRYGVQTKYEHDVLGREKTVTNYFNGTADQPEVVTTYVYNGTTMETQVNGVTVSATITNTAGEATSSTHGGGTTSFTSNLTFTDGGVAYDKRVTWLPNGSGTPATIEEWYYKDGSLRKRFGTGTQGAMFEYGVSEGIGTYVNEVSLTSNGSVVSGIYFLRATDYAGHTAFTEVPAIEDGMDPFVTNYVYNELGQLEMMAWDALPPVKYEYDNLGRQDLVEVDAEGGAKTTTDTVYEEYSNVTVRKVTTRQYTGASTYIETIARTRVDGLGSWVLSEGLWTNTTVEVNPGNKTVVTAVTHPDSTRIVTTTINGRTASVEHQNSGNTTLTKTGYTYDAFGRVATSTDLRNGTTSYTYDTAGRVLTVTTPDPDTSGTGAGKEPIEITNAYTNLNDGAGTQVVTSVKPVGGGNVSVTTQQYYPTGELKSVAGAAGYQAEYTYDPAGRVKTLTTHPAAGNATTTWVYSPAGYLKSKTDAGNNTVTYTYDGGGRLVEREWAREAVTTYGYTEAGHLETITYSGNLTANVTYGGHDRLGRPGNITDGSGTRTLTYNGSTLTTESYTSGILDGFTVARGLDANRRVSNLTVTEGNSSIYSVAYDWSTTTGRLNGLSWDNTTVSYTYVANSTLVQTVSAGNLTDGREYDKLNRVTQAGHVFVPGGDPDPEVSMNWHYGYNHRGQRAAATLHAGNGNASSADPWWEYVYDSNGNTTKPGQLTEAQRYSNSTTATPGFEFGYDYDGAGNRNTETVNGQTTDYWRVYGSSYGGTLLNQVSLRIIPRWVDVRGVSDPSATVTVDEQAAVQVGGNWWAALNLDEMPEGWEVDNSEAVQELELWIEATIGNSTAVSSGAAFIRDFWGSHEYDDDGNLTNDNLWTFVWDGENRLASMQCQSWWNGWAWVGNYKLEFVRDDRGRCVATKLYWWDSGWDLVAVVRRVFDGWQVVREWAPQGDCPAIERTYVWGLDVSGTLGGAGGVGGLVLSNITDVFEAASGKLFYYYDANGNVSDIAKVSDGEHVAHYEYDPFGKVVLMTGDWAPWNLIRFSTKATYDDDVLPVRNTGLYDCFNRPYSMEIGRFICEDPINEPGAKLLAGAYRRPMNLTEECNRYTFVGNDPINYYDTMGMMRSGSPSDAPPGWKPPGSNPGYVHNDNENNCAGAILEAYATMAIGNIFPGLFIQYPGVINDKYQHCVSSCKLTYACGERTARALGFAKETRDELMGEGASADDFVANYKGIAYSRKCGKKKDCESLCKQL